MPTSLDEHARVVAHELELLALPAKPWVSRVEAPDGTDLLDVVVVGAGMGGLAAAGALKLRGLTNVLVLDRAPEGLEGPWLTTARMQTLRSPKHLPGVDLGLPSLTFRAWYTARDGAAAWERLGKIPSSDWMAYLSWIREVLALPVRNDANVIGLTPSGGPSGSARGGHVAVHLDSDETLYARQVVLATGRLGVGGPLIPPMVHRDLWPDLAAHTSEPIDLGRLAGRRVAVLGGGPSGWDVAAATLEAGAATADLYVRRPVLPQVNKFRAAATSAFFDGWSALTPDQRWRLVCFLDDHDTPPPHESVLRALALPGFTAHLGTPVIGVRRAGGAAELSLADGTTTEADFLALATGYAVDLRGVPELASVQHYLATWGDLYRPPPGLERPDRAAYPYLGAGFELTERVPGSCPALGRVRLFNQGAFASLGAVASDIPGVSSGAARLATALVREFFQEDLDHVIADLAAYDEAELASTPFYARTAEPPVPPAQP